jgi:hypothetical protein
MLLISFRYDFRRKSLKSLRAKTARESKILKTQTQSAIKLCQTFFEIAGARCQLRV